MEICRHYDYHALREPFHIYLRTKYPNRSEKTNRTVVNDALAVFSWMREEEAWDFVTDLERTRKRQLDFLADEFLSHRRNPRKDAGGYLRAVNEFREFIQLVLLIDAARKRLPRRLEIDNTFEVSTGNTL